MADFLPPAVQKFIADVEQYVDPVQKAERETQQFSREVEKAGISADKAMGKAAAAARKAEVAQKGATEAAEKLAKGEIKVDEASKIAAKAVDELARANIAEREASIAAANAADKQADQYRQLARNAAMAAAAEYVAHTKATGTADQHRRAVESVTKAFPELAKSAGEAFKVADRSAGQFGKMLDKVGKTAGAVGPLWIIGIVNAVAMLPQIMAVAGGAITLGFGAILTAIGIMVAMKNKAIKQSYQELGKGISSTMKRLTIPFESTMLEIAKAAIDAGRSIEGSLGGAFANIAPAVSEFSHYLATAIGELNPMIKSLGVAFAALMRDLGPRMPEIMRNIGTGFKAIFDAVSKNPEALSNFIVMLSQLIKIMGQSIGVMIRFKDQIKLAFEVFTMGGPPLAISMLGKLKSAIGNVFGSGKQMGDQVRGTTSMFITFGKSAEDAATGMSEVQRKADPVTAALRNQKSTVDQLKQAFDRLTGANISAVQAESNMQQAIDDTTAALKANGRTLDLHTQKGRDNMAQLIANAHAFQDKLIAMKNDGATQSQLAKEAEHLRQVFYNQARQLGANSKDARTLTNRLLGITKASKSIPRTIRQDIYQVMHLTASQAYLNKRKNILGYAHGGSVRGYADGGGVSGQVQGPGTDTSDSIVAFLSKNEFVVNARQAKKHKALLEAINNGTQGFAAGGQVMGTWKHTGMKLQKTVEAITKKNAKRSHFTGNTTAEYRASHAMAALIKSMRKSPMAAWMVRGGVGSAAPSVVQQHTSVNLYVAGSVRSDRDLESMIQAIILQRNLRNPTSGVNLPAGRAGAF